MTTIIKAVLGTCNRHTDPHGLHDGHECRGWHPVPARDKRWDMIRFVVDSAGDTLTEFEAANMVLSLIREMGEAKAKEEAERSAHRHG